MLALLCLSVPAGHAVLRHGAYARPVLHVTSSPARCTSPRMADRAWRGSRDLPQKLLLQSAIQAQLSYAQEFKNELMGRWLTSFLGHEHLRVVRTGDYGSGRITYRGLDGGLRCSWSEYFRTMLSSGTQTYEVQYRVGTADIGHWPKPEGEGSDGEQAAPKSADGEPYPWAAAAASRRANPHLQKAEPTFKTYTEVIEPRRVARGLMQVREQLSEEWAEDLLVLAREGDEMRAWFCQREAQQQAQRQAQQKEREAAGDAATIPSDLCNVVPREASSLDDSAAPAAQPDWASDGGSEGAGPQQAAASRSSRPEDGPAAELLALLFANVKACWSDASTPFRALNYDLLQRAIAREAALRTIGTLREGAGTAATADWLLAELDQWLPTFEAPLRRYEGGHFVLNLMAQGPSVMTLPDGSVGLVDPARAVDELLVHRARIALEWIEAVQLTAEEHAKLLRDDLTKQLNAEMSQGDAD